MPENELQQRVAVEDALVALFMCTDAKDWAGVRRLFAPKVRFDMSSLSGQAPAELTPEQIAAMWEAGLKDIPIVHHQGGNYQIRIDGFQAQAHYYGVAFHHRPNPSNRNTRIFVGSYDAHLVRAGEGWKIDAFRYNSQFVEGNLQLEQ